jgi:hypothetical protein
MSDTKSYIDSIEIILWKGVLHRPAPVVDVFHRPGLPNNENDSGIVGPPAAKYPLARTGSQIIGYRSQRSTIEVTRGLNSDTEVSDSVHYFSRLPGGVILVRPWNLTQHVRCFCHSVDIQPTKVCKGAIGSSTFTRLFRTTVVLEAVE